MKILYLDTETTGLTYRSTIIQLAAIVEIDGEIKETINLYCAPFPDSDISEEALSITKFTREEIFQFDSPQVVCQTFTQILGKYVDKYNKNDKFIVIGHNVKFDLDMLRNWAYRCNERFIASYIDFKNEFDTLAFTKCLKILGRLPQTENNKLKTLCQAFQIPLENAHNALADTIAAKDLYHYLQNK